MDSSEKPPDTLNDCRDSRGNFIPAKLAALQERCEVERTIRRSLKHDRQRRERDRLVKARG